MSFASVTGRSLGLNTANLRIGGRALSSTKPDGAQPAEAAEKSNEPNPKGKANGLNKTKAIDASILESAIFQRNANRIEQSLYNQRGLLKAGQALSGQALNSAATLKQLPFNQSANNALANPSTFESQAENIAAQSLTVSAASPTSVTTTVTSDPSFIQRSPLSLSSSGSLIAGKGDVIVEINSSSSGYNNKIYYSTDNFQTKQYIGIDNQLGTFNLGSFAEGTQIQFGIDNGQGDFFQVGDASLNAVNVLHAKVSTTDSGTVIGFEDLYGGGDNDFNDAVITVYNLVEPSTSFDSSVTPDIQTNNNRSGLGDGTNPGQGGGRSNATNTGTYNPSAGFDQTQPTQTNQPRIDITV